MNATLMARKQRYSSCCAVLACYAVVTECNQAARCKGGARLYNMRSTARQAQCAATGPGERFSFPRRNADWNPRGRVIPSKEILLWATPSEPPRALQASECSELLDPTRTSYVILAQRQPGKLPVTLASPSQLSTWWGAQQYGFYNPQVSRYIKLSSLSSERSELRLRKALSILPLVRPRQMFKVDPRFAPLKPIQ